jgi:hypothetical protein
MLIVITSRLESSINAAVFPELSVLMSGIFHEVYFHQFPIEISTDFMLEMKQLVT